jgi:hypothetical protein
MSVETTCSHFLLFPIGGGMTDVTGKNTKHLSARFTNVQAAFCGKGFLAFWDANSKYRVSRKGRGRREMKHSPHVRFHSGACSPLFKTRRYDIRRQRRK